MRDLARRLRIKYSLTNNPSDKQIERFRSLIDTYNEEFDGDLSKAAYKAASEVFDDINTVVYFSQADTLETLLMLIKAKSKPEE